MREYWACRLYTSQKCCLCLDKRILAHKADAIPLVYKNDKMFENKVLNPNILSLRMEAQICCRLATDPAGLSVYCRTVSKKILEGQSGHWLLTRVQQSELVQYNNVSADPQELCAGSVEEYLYD